MIPALIPPLTGLCVLVTRPPAQAASLVERIHAAGGETYSFPAVEIEPVACAVQAQTYDYTIFLSPNAVRHGLQSLPGGASGRIAAIGRATAEALKTGGSRVDIEPTGAFDSEALLGELHGELKSDHRVLLVKGEGGRELLYESLRQRVTQVDMLEVYRRVRPLVHTQQRQELEDYWTDEGFGVVTLTSGEILANLDALLGERGKQLLRATAFITVSERIERMAREMGLQGESLIVRPDEDAMLGALAQWHTRARDVQRQLASAAPGSS